VEGVEKRVTVDPKFWRSKKVLVTGYAGFKGSWLCLWLLKMGARVIGYGLHPPYQPCLFEQLHLDKEMPCIQKDIRDPDGIREAIQQHQPHIVFHLAAQPLVPRSCREPLETFAVNAMGTAILMEAIRLYSRDVYAVINITSDKCYNNREWVWGYRENDPLGGKDPYSASKACAELITHSYRMTFFDGNGPAVATARAGNVIGGGDWNPDRLIPDWIRSYLGEKPLVLRSPYAVRPWQHVLDALSGYLLLAQKMTDDSDSFSGAWNFGPDSSDVQTVEWMIRRVEQHFNVSLPWQTQSQPRTPETHCLRLDSTKAKTLLGWRPRWHVEQAVEKVAEWITAYCHEQDLRQVSCEQIISYENG